MNWRKDTCLPLSISAFLTQTCPIFSAIETLSPSGKKISLVTQHHAGRALPNLGAVQIGNGKGFELVLWKRNLDNRIT